MPCACQHARPWLGDAFGARAPVSDALCGMLTSLFDERGRCAFATAIPAAPVLRTHPHNWPCWQAPVHGRVRVFFLLPNGWNPATPFHVGWTPVLLGLLSGPQCLAPKL